MHDPEFDPFHELIDKYYGIKYIDKNVCQGY